MSLAALALNQLPRTPTITRGRPSRKSGGDEGALCADEFADWF
jgi:hypothetical protein